MARAIWFPFLLLSQLQAPSRQLYVAGCESSIALGVASGKIPSRKISASTTHNSSNNLYRYGASQARLGIASFWCGSDRATWREDWVQFELDGLENVTGVAVEKGWLNNPFGILGEFYLQSSSDGSTFQNQTRADGSLVLHKLTTVNHHTEYFWFDVMVAKFIRIRASRLLISSSGSRFCGKFEIFGCSTSKPSDELYNIGLARNIIKDSQITASSSIPGNPPHHARLNFPNSWCPTTNADEWLQIDMGRALLVKGITTQGNYGRLSTDMVSAYLISFANSSTEPFKYIQNGLGNMTFFGNNQTSEDPVYNVIGPLVVARFIRIHPLAGYNGRNIGKMCIRLEVYASHPACSEDLMSATRTKFYPAISDRQSTLKPLANIFSKVSWCSHNTPSSSSHGEAESLQIDLGGIFLVTGISMTGSPNSDSWVTSFNIKEGLILQEMEMLKNTYLGTDSRVNVVTNWFEDPKMTRYLEIKPKQFFGTSCFRARALGCTLVPTISHIPRLLSIATGSSHVSFTVETNGSQSIKAMHIKYLCPNATYLLPCAKELSRVILWKYIRKDTINITNLHPATSYEMKLRYIFNGGQSSERKIENIVTLEKNPSQIPRMCNVTKATATTISLSWDHLPANSSNGELTGYHILLRMIKMNKTNVPIATSMVKTYIVSGLDSKTDYSIEIRAVNNAGRGPPCQLYCKTLSNGIPTGGNDSGRKTFITNSAIALISCSSGTMFVVISCILIKAFYEKMKQNTRKKQCQKHMDMIRSKTLMNSFELGGKKVNNAIPLNPQGCFKVVGCDRKKNDNLSPMPSEGLQYYRSLQHAAQTSGSRSGSAKIYPNTVAINKGGFSDDNQMRKIGYDGNAFGNLVSNELFQQS